MVKITYDKGYLKIPLHKNDQTFSIQVDNSINIKSFAGLFVEYAIMYKLSEPKYKKYLFGLIKSRRIPKPDMFIFKSDRGSMVIVLSYTDNNTILIIDESENVIEYKVNNKDMKETIVNVYKQCLGYVESVK